MSDSKRQRREKATVKTMIEMFCRAHHPGHGNMCDDCRKLYRYAIRRIEECPYGSSKPRCSKCRIHCYEQDMRERIREVMRYSGPKMLFHHPLLALLHVMDRPKRNGRGEVR